MLNKSDENRNKILASRERRVFYRGIALACTTVDLLINVEKSCMRGALPPVDLRAVCLTLVWCLVGSFGKINQYNLHVFQKSMEYQS